MDLKKVLLFWQNCCETFSVCCETFPTCCETFPVCCETFLVCCETFLVCCETFLVCCETFPKNPLAVKWESTQFFQILYDENSLYTTLWSLRFIWIFIFRQRIWPVQMLIFLAHLNISFISISFQWRTRSFHLTKLFWSTRLKNNLFPSKMFQKLLIEN